MLTLTAKGDRDSRVHGEAEVESPYLTIEGAARMARVSPKRIRNLMSAGVLRENVHYSRPIGIRARFHRQATIDWLENREQRVDEGITMIRGYRVSPGQQLREGRGL